VDHAALVWGYALVWFVVEDQVKLLAYRAFDCAKPALLARPAAA
jgi:H+-transporting ATPase